MKRLVLAALGALFAASGAAPAQEAFPSRPVKIVVPFPAGGTADILPRIVAEGLSERWKQPVIVENRAGAGGNIGADLVAQAAPDGYTLLASPPGPLAINRHLYKQLAFDSTKFVPITILAAVPNVLVVSPTVKAASMTDLIAKAKAAPEKITFASQGAGSTSHLTGNLFQTMAGVKLLHVPYKGTAPALTDLLGGHVDLMFDNLASSLPHHKGGKLRILAVGGPARAPALPDVPTVAEAGLPGFQSVTFFGMVAPPGTPAATADDIGKLVVEILKRPEVRARFQEQGAESVGNTPAEAAKFITEESARWEGVIKTANVTID